MREQPKVVRGKYTERLKDGARVVVHSDNGDQVYTVRRGDDGRLKWEPHAPPN